MEKKITSTQIIDSNPNIPPTIVRAVIRRVGGETITDCTQADAGWPGFSYYKDTVTFFNAHRPNILTMLNSTADSLGETAAQTLESFRCLAPVDEQTRTAIYSILSGRPAHFGSNEEVQVANALAWFALEEVANAANNL